METVEMKTCLEKKDVLSLKKLQRILLLDQSFDEYEKSV